MLYCTYVLVRKSTILIVKKFDTYFDATYVIPDLTMISVHGRLVKAARSLQQWTMLVTVT